MSTKKLDDVRREIAGAQQKIRELEQRQVPVAVALQRLEHAIADRGSRWLASARPEEFLLPVANIGDTAFSRVAKHDPLDIACSLFPDRVFQVLAERLSSQAAGGIEDGQRRGEIKKLREQLAKLEMSEERLVVDLEMEGVDVDRRPDADPLIVLGWTS
jgi:hypothetical protein